MHRRIPFALTLGLMITAVAVAADASKEDHAALQGSWTAVSGEVAGQAVNDEALRVFKIVVQDDKITFAGNESKFAVDASKTPKVIAVTPLAGPRKGKTQRAIYAIENNTFKLCLASDPAKPAPTPPTGFATQPGDGWVLVTFKRDVAPADGK